MGLHLSNEDSSSIFQPLLWKLSDYNEMKRLDVIFPLIKCIVIYNHNNSPGMSLRNEFFCFIPYPTYPTYILHILQITTKNFVQFSIFNFFAPRKLCSTFFCLPWTLFNWLNFLHWHFCSAYICAFPAIQHFSIWKKCSMISFQRNIIIDINNWHLFKM